MRRILVGLALVAAISPAWGQKVISREQTLQRSVVAGQELRVVTYARFHRDCTPLDPPKIVMRAAPAHGSVTLRPGPTTVTFVREGEPDCSGKTYQGLGVWYVPAPGYHGVDQFDWDVVDEKTSSHDTAVVQVR